MTGLSVGVVTLCPPSIGSPWRIGPHLPAQSSVEQAGSEFQRRLARERLGLDPWEIRGGHLVALSNPVGLARAIADLDAALA